MKKFFSNFEFKYLTIIEVYDFEILTQYTSKK